MDALPRIPLNKWVDAGIEYLTTQFGNTFDHITNLLKVLIIGLEQLLIAIPPVLLIAVFALLAWRFVNKRAALFTIAGLYLVYNLNLWGPSLRSLSMIIIAVLLCIVIGMPLGILAAKNNTAHNIITPVLDFMQTLPAFVYLLPAVTFFGLGVVPGVIATLIFAMPPVIRLTDLGIKQVPEELVELGKSFGSTFYQMLFKIELPLARPTIMAGINQCIMLSLSMVVIAAMIGAKGLGGEVWRGIQRMQIGDGFEAGIAIVVIAIILDRITQSFGKR